MSTVAASRSGLAGGACRCPLMATGFAAGLALPACPAHFSYGQPARDTNFMSAGVICHAGEGHLLNVTVVPGLMYEQ